MDFVQSDSTFLIPLSHPGGTPGILPEFVADENNPTLRYFLNPFNLRSSDWPLVLFGPTGTGKTVLAHSLVKPDMALGAGKPVYQTFVDFSRLFQSAVDTDSTQEFRRRYLKAGLVVLDDLHEFARFPMAQQEMVYLLDQLQQTGSPLIVTSNQPVQLIDGLLPQLVSRLLNGLSVEIKPPGVDARRIIVDRLASLHGVELALGAAEILVDRLPLTLPKINQFFIQYLVSRKEPSAIPISRENLLACFNQLNATDQEKFVDLIIRSVATEFKLSPADIRGSSRKQTTAMARAISIYLHRTLLLMSFAKIGSYYGGRDHSTVMHAYRKVLDLLGDERNDNLPRNRTLKLESQLHEVLAVNI